MARERPSAGGPRPDWSPVCDDDVIDGMPVDYGKFVWSVVMSLMRALTPV